MSRSRDIATILGTTEQANVTNNPLLNTASSVGLDSAQVLSLASSVADLGPASTCMVMRGYFVASMQTQLSLQVWAWQTVRDVACGRLNANDA